VLGEDVPRRYEHGRGHVKVHETRARTRQAVLVPVHLPALVNESRAPPRDCETSIYYGDIHTT
jgi:hypothetical protein